LKIKIGDMILRTLLILFGLLFVLWVTFASLNIYYYDFSFRKAFISFSFFVLLIFLVILVIRYIALIYFSYLNYTFRYSEKDADSYPMVSIIVPVHNEGKNLEETIKSLVGLEYPQVEVIIVDDGSTDNTLEIAKSHEGQFGSSVIKVMAQVNQGKATALNNGLKVSSGEFVLTIDGDSLVDKFSVKRAIHNFRDEKVGAVAGNVRVINRKTFLAKLQALEYIEGLNMVKRSQTFFKAVNIVPGPFGVFRRKAIEQVGGYDHDTFAEDCDLTVKLLAAGWKVDYEPEAIAWTEAPENINSLLVQRYRWSRGILQVLLKHRHSMFNFRANRTNVFTIWYMFFEAIIWPGMNIFAQIFFVYVALSYNMFNSLLFWWIQLTLLDMTAALHCVLLEKERLSYVLYAVPYRVFFIQIIDVTKLLATVEELMGVKMEWGKIERKGRLKESRE